MVPQNHLNSKDNKLENLVTISVKKKPNKLFSKIMQNLISLMNKQKKFKLNEKRQLIY